MERTVTLVNKLGLHARAAAKLVTLAGTFKSEIRLRKDGREVSGKSMMGVMMLAAACGSRLTLVAEGPDAQEALDRIEALITGRFGEDA
ncbi:MAG: HPr family phosphocarrier protein [Nevskiales bacterium]|nr:HPr family phosphocarrier protein [Nevskiales bacterium]